MTEREMTGDAVEQSPARSTVPVRRADPRLALVALAVLCAACIAIGFALGRTL